MADLFIGVAITVTIRHLEHTEVFPLHWLLMVHSLVVALRLHQVNRDVHCGNFFNNLGFHYLWGLFSLFFRSVLTVILTVIVVNGLNTTKLDDWQLLRLGS